MDGKTVRDFAGRRDAPGLASDGSNERLLQRVASGDRGAMELLYARHHLRVYRFVLRLVNDAATAEDVTSDVFLEVWKHADRFEGRSQVSTWILAIARYKALTALRSRTNDPLDDETANEIPDSADDPELSLQKQNESAVLRQCLTHLSPAHREIIDLVYYHEKSVAEVAEILGVPKNTVKTRMFHARKRLAALLDARGFASQLRPSKPGRTQIDAARNIASINDEPNSDLPDYVSSRKRHLRETFGLVT